MAQDVDAPEPERVHHGGHLPHHLVGGKIVAVALGAPEARKIHRDDTTPAAQPGEDGIEIAISNRTIAVKEHQRGILRVGRADIQQVETGRAARRLEPPGRDVGKIAKLGVDGCGNLAPQRLSLRRMQGLDVRGRERARGGAGEGQPRDHRAQERRGRFAGSFASAGPTSA